MMDEDPIYEDGDRVYAYRYHTACTVLLHRVRDDQYVYDLAGHDGRRYNDVPEDEIGRVLME